MATLELGIGKSVCVDGGKVKGIIKGVERRDDESICGLVLKCSEKMVHVDLREGAAATRILACDNCPGCMFRTQGNNLLN